MINVGRLLRIITTAREHLNEIKVQLDLAEREIAVVGEEKEAEVQAKFEDIDRRVETLRQQFESFSLGVQNGGDPN